MKLREVFEGVKVADFSWVIVGPRVARELAVHGATVVRVESHRVPDMLRVTAPFREGIAGIDRSALWMAYNTNKYGMSLHLSNPKAQEIARKLVMWADIVTDSMTPGTLKRFGLDYESVRKIKPDIIYYSTTQAGQYGPYAKFQAYGQEGAAIAGFYDLFGWPDRPPAPPFTAYTDQIAYPVLLATLMGALAYRRKTGKGMYLEHCQWEAGMHFLGPALLDYRVNGRVLRRMGNSDPYAAPHAIYQCQGTDRWVAITVRHDAEWKAFCAAIGAPEWTKEPRFATLLGRKENEDELNQLVENWTSGYTPEEVMWILQNAGVPAGVLQNNQDLFEDPQLKHRGHFQWLPHKVIGMASHQAPSYRLSKTPYQLKKAGPALGEDNEFVYKNILGYSDEDMAQFLLDGIITTEADVPYVSI